MLIIDIIFGLLAIYFTIKAYSQISRILFLKFNIIAVTFFGLNLLVNNGISGAFISFLNAIIYLISIYTSKSIRLKLTYILPVVAFIVSLTTHNASLTIIVSNTQLLIIHYIPAIGTFFITLAALQLNMVANKIILFIGVFLWAIYSYAINAWFALCADIIGMIVILYSLKKLKHSKILCTH